MRIEFLDKFDRDLDDITAKHVRQAVEKTIVRVENAKTLADVPQVKKLSGFKSAFRIRIGDYRIGIFVDGDLVQFARVVHRKDIYRVFP